MDKRILGIVALLVLAVAVVWTLRSRTPAVGLTEPARVELPAKLTEIAPLTSSDAAHPARQSVGEVAAPTADRASAGSTFALVKVLVLDRSTQTPLADIEVIGAFDKMGPGQPIKTTSGSRGKPYDKLHTDDKGLVEIEMPPDVPTRVSAYGSDHNAGSDDAKIPPLKAGDVRAVTLEIPTGDDMPFWMKLVDDPSGAPVTGANITTDKGGASNTKSDADGLAFVQSRSWSPGLLGVQAEGYAETWLKPEPGHAQSDAALVVKLAKCATVRLHVIDAADHAIANAKIDLMTEGYNLGRSGGGGSLDLIGKADPHWHGTTDESGEATITCVPARVAIQAGITSPKSWHPADKLVFEPGETRRIEWKLSNGCDVHGLVLDQTNAPVTKREMWMRKATRKTPVYLDSSSTNETLKAVTDDQGRFRFTDVGAGTWWLGPSAPKSLAKVVADDVAAFAQIVEIVEGASDLDVDVHVDRGLLIRGQVLDPKGAPVRSAYVRGYELSGKIGVSANFSGNESVFSVGPLMKGRYLLVAHGLGGDADSDPVEVDAGAQDVTLRLKTGASISGTVVNPAGEHVEAQMWMKMRGSATFGVHGVSCNAQGAFQIEGLPAGTFDVAATDSDGATGLLEGVVVETGESKSGLTIRLAPGGHVRVRHEGPDRFANIEVLSHGVLVTLDGVERSTSKEFAAPAGSVTVQATYHESGTRVVERTVEVKAGQTVDVVFEKDAH
jgi:hypothetical protein